MSGIDQTRHYLFGVEGNPDNAEQGANAFLVSAPSASTPNDFRVIIGLCCTLILRYGANIDPEVLASIERIKAETGLVERLN